MSEPMPVVVQFDERNKISAETTRAMFDNICCRTAGLTGADFKGFMVGVRFYERLLREAGFDPQQILNERSVIERKQPVAAQEASKS